MLKLLESYLRRKELNRYADEAAQVISIQGSLLRFHDAHLARSLHNCAEQNDRESLLVGFATVAEMSRRKLGMTPFKVQIMGALAMVDGKISEMATGEGKTLTAAMPLAWFGAKRKAHAMTVNDYLAKRDAELLAPLYEALDLSVSYLQNDMPQSVRQLAYQSSVVYGTPQQFVFDYLRDHIAYRPDDICHQGLEFALIDEADSILIDEARTPLILSGEGDLNSDLWVALYQHVSSLSSEEVRPDDRTKLEKLTSESYLGSADIAVSHADNSAIFTSSGIEKNEQFLIQIGLIKEPRELWLPEKSYLWRMLIACARAKHLFKLDQQYLIKDGKVIIIDQETGRLSIGRRWNEGLHQAIEAKEDVEVNPESKDLGRISLASFLSLYGRVAGMTGTAMTEALEISNLYGLSVVGIPTHKPRIRIDHPDQVFLTTEAKYAQIIEDVRAIHAKGQPILIGTASVEESEKISGLLLASGVPHRVLNARQDALEALVVAQAGRLNAVTVATSMAGRGTDILLGGNGEILSRYTPEQLAEAKITMPLENERDLVIALGGLFVIGCQRLDSRRLDLQLSGRSGRQGDPGESRFYVALDDPLLKHHGGAMIGNMLRKMGLQENEGVEHPMIDKAIIKAQSKKQSMYAGSRKQGLQQDSILDAPRNFFFARRRELLWLEDGDFLDRLQSNVTPAVQRLLSVHMNSGQGYPEQWDLHGVREKLSQWGLSTHWFDKLYQDFESNSYIFEPFERAISQWVAFDLNARVQQLEEKGLIIRDVLLRAIDRQWQILLEESESIRSGIHLRAYAQEKPDQAFKKEIFALFEALNSELPVVNLDYIYSAIRQYEAEIEPEGSLMAH